MEKYYPYIKRLIRIFRLEKFIEKDSQTKEAVKVLYRCEDRKKIFEEIWCRRVFMLLAAVCASGLMFIACFLEEQPEKVIIEGRYIQNREETDQVTFEVSAETEKGTIGDELTLQIGENEEEAEDAVQEEEEPDQREILLSEIREAVENAVFAQNEKERIELPGTVSGKKITYSDPEYHKDFSAFYLSLSLLVLLPFLWNRKQNEKLCERENQLLLDYPELVNKIMLLLSAGLTIRGCFERLCEEYKDRLRKGGECRYAYEEIRVSFQEMKHGVSEPEAVEAFGKRCRQLPYLRFSSIINQNIRKGSEDLTRLLEVEAMEAFEKRKEAVKVMGETAGTKLLLPMVLMLGVVMAIIIVPAFMTM